MDTKSLANKKNDTIVIVLATVLVLVIALYVWQYFSYGTSIRQIREDKSAIQAELDAMVQSYDSLETENDTLNYNLELAQSEVRDLLLEVEQVRRASYAQISRYKKEVSTLRDIMRNYVVQIDSLNERNKLLMAENLQVKKEVSVVKGVNVQLEKEKKKLEQKVMLASQLEAISLYATGINRKGNDTGKAKKIEKIKVGFTLSKNATAQRGPKYLYIRIQHPDERLMIKSEKDVFRYDGANIPYSARREVEYEGNELPVNIFWDNKDEPLLTRGVYRIDVFADGNNIGTTTFEVK